MQSEPGSGFPKAQGIRLHHREWDEASAPDPGMERWAYADRSTTRG